MIEWLSQEPGQGCTNSEYLLNELSKIELDAHALQLIEQPHLAYLSAKEDVRGAQDDIARIVNGEVVTETDSDDPESYAGI